MRYIEFVGGIGIGRHELAYAAELRSIGEFTRKNVAKWLESPTGPCTPECFPIEDFHAVCDDMEIPWATKEGKDCYRRVSKLGTEEKL